MSYKANEKRETILWENDKMNNKQKKKECGWKLDQKGENMILSAFVYGENEQTEASVSSRCKRYNERSQRKKKYLLLPRKNW